MLIISPDGYIRLSVSQLASIKLVHLISGLDEDMPPFQGESAAATAITGYTEWVSTTTPAISMGWDWTMEVVNGQVRPARLGEPRSNCMLVDEGNGDLGPAKSNAALAEFVDTLPWQSETESQIASRYCR
jgi:hypothetical protein